ERGKFRVDAEGVTGSAAAVRRGLLDPHPALVGQVLSGAEDGSRGLQAPPAASVHVSDTGAVRHFSFLDAQRQLSNVLWHALQFWRINLPRVRFEVFDPVDGEPERLDAHWRYVPGLDGVEHVEDQSEFDD